MDKDLRLLSLCKKANRLVSGDFAVTESIEEKICKLLILAKDSSDNTKKKYYNKAKYYNIPIIEAADKSSLAKAIGKNYTAIISVIDERFATMIIGKWR